MNTLPIFICVVLPIAITAIIYASSMFSDRQRTKVLLKAIESNNSIDADKLAETLQKPGKSATEILNLRLLRGCIFTLIGIALCIVSLVAVINGEKLFEDDAATVPLVFGGISVAIGISYLIVYFVTRKQADK